MEGYFEKSKDLRNSGVRRVQQKLILCLVFIHFLADGFIYDICLLVLARKLGMRVVESPCVFKMQSSTIGVGKKFVGTAFKMAKEVLELKNVIKDNRLLIQ